MTIYPTDSICYNEKLLSYYNGRNFSQDTMPYNSYSDRVTPPPQTQNPVNTSFRGVSSKNIDTQPDIVEISAENKIKTNKKMSKGLKWLLGLSGTAAAVYGCIVGKRALNKPTLEKITKDLSEIFRRDITQEEASNIAKRYKDLFKIDDTNEFCKKMFEQIKKDYGYEASEIKLEIFKLKDNKLSTLLNQLDKGSWLPSRGILKVYPRVPDGHKLTPMDKRELFVTMMHEFQHVKQSEYAYRTNVEELINAFNLRNGEKAITTLENILNEPEKLKNLAKSWNETEEKTKQLIEEYIEEAKNGSDLVVNVGNRNTIKENLNKIFGQFKPFDKNSENYKQGLKYLENEKNYISPEVDPVGYREQLLEKEAYGIEDKSKSITDYFESIWRVF